MIQINFDSEKCAGCFACYVACLDAHHDISAENANSFRAVKRLVSRERNFEKKICPGCLHCGTCMEVCPTGALYCEEETGLILTDREKCIGCRKCENVCPQQVIHFDGAGKIEKCDGCIERLRAGREPACVRACSMEAITWKK